MRDDELGDLDQDEVERIGHPLAVVVAEVNFFTVSEPFHPKQNPLLLKVSRKHSPQIVCNRTTPLFEGD